MGHPKLVAEDLGRFGLGFGNPGEFVEGVIEAIPVPFYVWSVDGVLLLANRGWEEATGIQRHLALGRSCSTIFPVEMAHRFLEVNRRVIEEGEAVHAEEFVEKPEGRHIYSTVKFPIRDHSGRIVAVGGVSFEKN